MKQKLLFSALCAMLLLAACQPVSTPVPASLPPTSAPAQPTEAPTATQEPTTQPTPVPMDQINIAANLPGEVASGFSVTTVAGSTEFHPHPEYRTLALNDYAISEAFNQARIDVFSIDEFSKVSVSIAKIPFDLKLLLSSQQAQAGQRLPFLSVDIEAQTFTAKPKFLSFANGSGIRYLTQYTQGIYPVTNSRMIYTFQGITSDGKYYVSAILPEGAAFLPDDFDGNNPNAGLPEGGIVFPFPTSSGEASDSDLGDFTSQVKNYHEAILNKIEQTPDEDYTIPLSTLDAMIQSLEVQAP